MLNDHPYVKIIAVWLFTIIAIGIIYSTIVSTMGLNRNDLDMAVTNIIMIYFSVVISMSVSSSYASNLGVNWIMPFPVTGPQKTAVFTALIALVGLPMMMIIVIIDLMIEFNNVDLFPYWIAFAVSLIISAVCIVICRKYFLKIKHKFNNEWGYIRQFYEKE